uniref:Uncharacterized protein n=1 Tax=virus sp. ctx9V1 TaxID=2828001 RepID=A0A8S5RDS7_9VIRU|nr:MAG TPA: hypothetical protein [virus sp. ctx9V1]
MSIISAYIDFPLGLVFPSLDLVSANSLALIY